MCKVGIRTPHPPLGEDHIYPFPCPGRGERTVKKRLRRHGVSVVMLLNLGDILAIGYGSVSAPPQRKKS